MPSRAATRKKLGKLDPLVEFVRAYDAWARLASHLASAAAQRMTPERRDEAVRQARAAKERLERARHEVGQLPTQES